ncbi:hypothetical protein FACS1894133_2990 [Clostridia bacterium]|nr:hypothetical protein FACS1894133_2990 [Clostridia bacterium]
MLKFLGVIGMFVVFFVVAMVFYAVFFRSTGDDASSFDDASNFSFVAAVVLDILFWVILAKVFDRDSGGSSSGGTGGSSSTMNSYLDVSMRMSIEGKKLSDCICAENKDGVRAQFPVYAEAVCDRVNRRAAISDEGVDYITSLLDQLKTLALLLVSIDSAVNSDAVRKKMDEIMLKIEAAFADF